MPQKLIAYWNSLPAWLKTCIVIATSASSGVIRHMYVTEHGCLTEHCILEYLYSGIYAGGVAVVFYFLRSPLGKQVEAEMPALNAQSFMADPLVRTVGTLPLSNTASAEKPDTSASPIARP